MTHPTAIRPANVNPEDDMPTTPGQRQAEGHGIEDGHVLEPSQDTSTPTPQTQPQAQPSGQPNEASQRDALDRAEKAASAPQPANYQDDEAARKHVSTGQADPNDVGSIKELDNERAGRG